MTSTADREENLVIAERLVRGAAARGAEFVALPENFSLMATEGLVIEPTEPVEGPTAEWGRGVAASCGVDLLLGSIPETADRPRMRHNTSVLITRAGEIAASYRKIHMFDVRLSGRSLVESSAVAAGTETVTADLEWGRIGMSVCYDLRFAELYRTLRRAGAEVLTVPSAFTAETGPAHWSILLRARAVENQAFVVAPAQTGVHAPGRASYGHAMIVGPWGEVLDDAGPNGEGVAVADLDPRSLAQAAERIPCLEHARDWLVRGERAEGSDES